MILSTVMPSVIVLNVVILSVVAPKSKFPAYSFYLKILLLYVHCNIELKVFCDCIHNTSFSLQHTNGPNEIDCLLLAFQAKFNVL